MFEVWSARNSRACAGLILLIVILGACRRQSVETPVTSPIGETAAPTSPPPLEIETTPLDARKESVSLAGTSEQDVQLVVEPPTDKANEKAAVARQSANVEVATAIRAAQTSRKQSQVAAKEGKLSLAYSGTLAAWESLQKHPDDQVCRALSAELLKDLQSYGEDLSLNNTGLSPNTVNKPVRFE